MKKQFTLDQLDKTSPFRVPEGYFETLTSRVMAAIPEDEPAAVKTEEQHGGKVVGMIPRKNRQGWKRWVAVAAAACLCGVVLMITRPNGKADEDQQTAQTKIVNTTPQEGTVANMPVKAAEPTTKVYANAAYDLNARGRRSSAASEPTPQTLMASVSTPKMKSTASSAATQPAAVKASTSAPTAQPKAIAKAESAIASIDIAASDVDKYANECDVIDYTQMGGSDIYDYLAGADYY